MTASVEGTPGLLIVDELGVYPDMDEADYHRDPWFGRSLSFSGAKKLLQASPAQFEYDRRHGTPHKRTFDVGHAAHLKVLGKGAPVEIVMRYWSPTEGPGPDVANDYKSGPAQAHRDDIYARGLVPLLAKEAADIDLMAEAVLRNAEARRLLEHEAAMAEVSMFWRCEWTGVVCRSRVDLLFEEDHGFVTAVDYKTAASAKPETFGRKAFDFGYHQQAPWYREGVMATAEHPDEVDFVFIVQEKTAPYLTSVCRIDFAGMAAGHDTNIRARELYQDCAENDTWPGYPDEIVTVSLPPWATR